MAKGTVYLVNAKGTNRYKIGYTNRQFSERFAELNSNQTPYPLTATKTILVKDAYTIELKLHHQFKQFRKHGEWFEFDSRQIKEVCKAMDKAAKETDSIPFLLMMAGILVMLFTTCQNQPSQPTNTPVIQPR